ncbi:MAG: putative phosphatidate cytidylyltransferase [Bacteroidetes bacterium]|nr:MAG: putative phosphatidate cytidylyltransferase [Bacteroidota bacterium]
MTQVIGDVLIRWDVLLLVWSLFGLSALLIAFRPSDDKPLMWKKYFVYLLIVHIVFTCIALHWFGILATVIFVGAAEEVWGLKNPEKKVAAWKRIIALLFVCFLGFGFIFFAAKGPVSSVWSIYASVVIFDGISQLAGQTFGRTRFAPKISPNKTLEGFITGWLFSFGALFLLEDMEKTDIIFGACIGPVALLGDLLASYYKRLHGIKDYGNWIPGHGGILDRFDSLLMVGAVVFYAGMVWLMIYI